MNPYMPADKQNADEIEPEEDIQEVMEQDNEDLP